MRIDPYISVNGIPFTLSRADVIRMHGPPHSEIRNEVGLTALDYGDAVYRFQDGGCLEEVTMPAQVLNLGQIAVPFASLEAFIRDQDSLAFERAGFLVSPKFGLAFVPREPYWVTALARHCIETWEALRPSLL